MIRFHAPNSSEATDAISNKVFWFILAMVTVTIAIVSHWPEINGFFQVDDFLWLHLASWRSVLDSFVGTQGEHVAYRPLFRLSVYIDALLFGRDASGWHVENMIMHAMNSVLLALLMRTFRISLSVCAAAALLFSLAPLSGEGVNWVSGRTVVLCTTFMMLSLWQWTVALSRHKAPWAAIGWMIAAAATYEAAIVLPALCVCLAPLA
jgi:protein O-mannosyl-transferase